MTSQVHRVGLWLGPALFAAMLGAGGPTELSSEAWTTAAITVWMAVWWCTEAIPLSMTALVPLATFPIAGAGTIGEVAASYVSPAFFLLLGGFLIALAMQRWELHRRMALTLLVRAGNEPTRVIATFMFACAFLSLWISNTATTLMILPTALSVAAVIAPNPDRDPAQREFTVALALGVAYASTIGGTGTLVGTPPNLLIAGHLANDYGIELTFADWIKFGLPLVLIMVPTAWLVLTKIAFRIRLKPARDAQAIIRRLLDEMGPLGVADRRTLIVIVAVALCWMFRALLNQIPGLEVLSDTSIAIVGALCLFVIPNGKDGMLLNSEWGRKVPWDVLLMYGGALALASGVTRTGLAEALGAAFAFAAAWPLFAISAIAVTTMLFWTEIVQNSAALATFLPVLAALSTVSGAPPLELAVPVAVAASYAFMLPVSTPPNAVVYGTGTATVPEMARAGLMLNLFAIPIILLVSQAYSAWIGW